MFKTLALICLGFLLATSAMAQVKVELLLEQRQYLLKETLMVGVRVINHSGQTLRLTGTNWLNFTVENRDKLVVKQIAPTPAPKPVEIETSYMATQWIDVGEAFAFRENNRFAITARVHLDQWNEDVYGGPAELEIIKGTALWQHEVGIPTRSGEPPSMRKYSLQQANYLKELQLYARVTDPSDQVIYGVLRLAPMVQVSQPEAQIDTLNRLHVLTQVGMKLFTHFTIDYNGRLLLRNSYETTTSRPQLKVTPGGGVYVHGGQRLIRLDDIPASPLMNQASGEAPTAPATAAETAAPSPAPQR